MTNFFSGFKIIESWIIFKPWYTLKPKTGPCLQATVRTIKVWMEDHEIKTLSCPAQYQDLNPIKTPGMWSRETDGTSHQITLSRLNFCTRSGLKLPKSKVKDWACQDEWKLWLTFRVIPPNFSFWFFINKIFMHYSMSKTLASCRRGSRKIFI